MAQHTHLVVGRKHERTLPLCRLERALERSDRRHVQMVRGLIREHELQRLERKRRQSHSARRIQKKANAGKIWRNMGV